MPDSRLEQTPGVTLPVTLTPDVAALPALARAYPAEMKINLAVFSDEGRRRLTQIAANVAIYDSSSALSFGAEPQQRFNAVLDKLLEGLRTSEVGVAGELTVELATSIKAMRLAKMKREAEGGDWVANSFGKLPVVGKYFSALRYFQLTHKPIADHLATITQKAEREMAKLKANNSKLDRLVDATLDNMKEVELHLAAGQLALERAYQDFAAKKAEAATSRDPVKLAQLRDYAEQINAFETRLLRMHIAFTDSMVAVPQIRATQEAGRIEISNIMDTLLFDLPRLKRAILQVGALAQISRAQQATEARRALTRQIGTLGADALQDAYTKAKASQGSVAEDLAVLASTADKLLETIALGVRIDEENRRHREQGAIQLGQIKNKLLDGMVANGERLLD